MSKLARLVGERLREVRGDRTLTQVEKSSGVSASTWHRCENGGLPSIDSILLIGRNEGVSLNWLVLGIEPKALSK